MKVQNREFPLRKTGTFSYTENPDQTQNFIGISLRKLTGSNRVKVNLVSSAISEEPAA